MLESRACSDIVLVNTSIGLLFGAHAPETSQAREGPLGVSTLLAQRESAPLRLHAWSYVFQPGHAERLCVALLGFEGAAAIGCPAWRYFVRRLQRLRQQACP